MFKGGENIKNVADSTGDSENQGRRSGKKFDHKFSTAARQYALSAANLGDSKWKKILSLAQTSSAADLVGADQDASQLSGVTENEEYLTAARAHIPVSDSENDDVSIDGNAEDEDGHGENVTDEEGGNEEASSGEERLG